MFKKIILLAILPIISFSQTHTLKIGLKVGSSFSTTSAQEKMEGFNLNKEDKNIMNYPGVLLGLYIKSKEKEVKKLNILYSFQSELLYNQKGYKYSNNDLSYYRERFNYIELSPNFNVRKGKISLHTGAYYALLIGGKRLKYNEITGYSSYQYDSFTFSNIDYGINLGTSLKINKNMVLSIRYSRGITSYSKDIESKNINYQLCLEYLFSQKK